VRCPACGTTALREAARFCDTCGTRLDSAEKLTEYKQVTVLFADVVRSMDIAAALGAERLRELMTELLEACRAVVQSYGGTVNQFTGDGFMALFGAPIAMEDHAVRACLAALDIQIEAQRLGVEFEQRYRVTLELRVGLNSGEVVAGDIGSGAMGYTVSGQQVGMAQRMESAAPPGGVMLSESTARLVEASTDLAEPELVRIKGSVEPVTARRLIAVGEYHGPKRRGETILVGRRREISVVAGALDQAIERQGRVVCVKGSAGIGKSRIAREAAAIAESRGVEVITTYCESHSAQIPFHAVAGLLRGFFGVGGLERAQATARVRTILPDADAEDLVLLASIFRDV
jgi:adenylate cyclase